MPPEHVLPPSDPSVRSQVLQSSALTRVVNWCLGRPPVVPVPRSVCQRLTLKLKGVPRRSAASSIGLQVAHLTGMASPAYAWRLDGDEAEVWYWAEHCAMSPGTLPCPEMLLRPALPDGRSLIRCQVGFEAINLVAGRVQRSRWFETLPDAQAWQQFARDAGVDPALHPRPAAQWVALGAAPPRAWSIHSSLLRPLSRKALLGLMALALAGAALFAAISYSVKLGLRIEAARQQHAALSAQYAAAIKLQREVEAQRRQIALIADVQPRVLQVRLMAGLAAAGLFDETTKVTLQEWEYRNGRVRLQFAVPPEGFVLGDFLASIEKLGLFEGVRLLPGAPPLSVALQANVVGDATDAKPASLAP